MTPRHRKHRRFPVRTWLAGAALAGATVGGFLASTPPAAPSGTTAASLLTPVHFTTPSLEGAVKAAERPRVVVSLVSYVIRSGDTLSQVAETWCGNLLGWRALQRFNHIPDANIITPGEIITLACK